MTFRSVSLRLRSRGATRATSQKHCKKQYETHVGASARRRRNDPRNACRTFRTTRQRRRKNDQKSLKNRSGHVSRDVLRSKLLVRASRRVSEAPRRCLGSVFGRSGVSRDRSGAPPGASWGVPGRPGSVPRWPQDLGTSGLRVLCDALGRYWALLNVF